MGSVGRVRSEDIACSCLVCCRGAEEGQEDKSLSDKEKESTTGGRSSWRSTQQDWLSTADKYGLNRGGRRRGRSHMPSPWVAQKPAGSSPKQEGKFQGGTELMRSAFLQEQENASSVRAVSSGFSPRPAGHRQSQVLVEWKWPDREGALSLWGTQACRDLATGLSC